MGNALPTVHFIFISTGLPDVALAVVESALLPDRFALFLDFEQPEHNRQPATAQSGRMIKSFFMGFKGLFR
jgi:hypothetical protein